MAKICPLLLIAVKEKGLINEPEKGWAECFKDECAWYVRLEVPKAEGCAIEKLTYSLKAIELKSRA